ncbi:MAG: DUF2059 domain-containing protein [Pseudomonadota bacterium]
MKRNRWTSGRQALPALLTLAAAVACLHTTHALAADAPPREELLPDTRKADTDTSGGADSKAAARDDVRKRALAAQLTELMQARRIATDFLEQCSKLDGSHLDPRRTFTTDKNAFGGITPWSQYWADIVVLYARYQARTCASVSAEKYAAFVTDQYASKLSSKDLAAAVKFYTSPAGRRFNDASVDTNASFQIFLFAQTNAAIPDATKDLRRDVAAVVERYKADPK